ncbi:O-antigen ligase family protein [Paraburkholderia sp. J11-2]|uniref:O-antigen ligase family protein n=1 Tax=Paraburkholderia sp. J11-2 TaxID=2805431 RepID=UPI002AB6EBDB|nr:O-antigen ligase family protein [Paraburkholderia sp. J11-2]
MGIVIILALVIGLPLIPRCLRVCLLLPLAVFQVYPPWLVVGQLPVPLALVVAYAFWPELLKEAKFLFSVKPIRIILGISIITVVSFLWSVNVRLGLVSLNAFLSFIAVFAGIASQARSDSRWITRALTIFYLAMMVFAASVVMFRFAPVEKLLFLKTNLATWFISSNTLTELFSDGRNNVFDPEKSGGFAFVNGNAASTFLGFVAMTALGSAFAYRSRSHFIMGIILTAAVPFAGSKAGMMLILPMLAVLFLFRVSEKDRGIVSILLVQVTAIAIISYKIMNIGHSGMSSVVSSRVADTADTRFQMWGFALKMFLENPILGQGFGGWQIEFPAYARFSGVPTDLPPHNTFIYLWSQSGIVALTLGVALVVWILKKALEGAGAADVESKGLGVMLLLSYTWLLIQGFGENQGLIGDVHIQPILATVLALFTVRASLNGKTTRGKSA